MKKFLVTEKNIAEILLKMIDVRIASSIRVAELSSPQNEISATRTVAERETLEAVRLDIQGLMFQMEEVEDSQ